VRQHGSFTPGSANPRPRSSPIIVLIPVRAKEGGRRAEMTENELIRIAAALILLAAVVQAGPTWVATTGLCVLTLILESVGTQRP
jgi:hypothetical protein